MSNLATIATNRVGLVALAIAFATLVRAPPYLCAIPFALFRLPSGRPRPRRTAGVPSSDRGEEDTGEALATRRGRLGPRRDPGLWIEALSKSGMGTSHWRMFLNHTVLCHK